MNRVRIEQVEKKYDDVMALDSITLDIDSGEVFTLLGINGSGKTTLLRILAGLTAPTKGCVVFNGKRMQSPELQRIATMIFQRTVMFNRSVFGNVGFGLKTRAYTKEDIRARVRQALESVGLGRFEGRDAKKLSGGEQQRVALARAFAVDPRILLLDEPTANLDPASAVAIENIIGNLREDEERIIVLSTHNLHQARRLSDRIAHIYRGRILEVACPDEFFTNPSNDMTRKFVSGELQF